MAPSSESEAEVPTPKRTRSSSKAKRKLQARKKVDDVEESEGALELDSDALDDSDDDRKKKKQKKLTSTPKPKRGRRPKESADEKDLELEAGQEVVGRIVKAPTTGLVPPGQISRNTLNFLKKLKDPACNDRQWFKLHGNYTVYCLSEEQYLLFFSPWFRIVTNLPFGNVPRKFLEPVYRAAEKEWKAFIEAVTNVLIEVDGEIPPLPPKDVVHRIYRDVRFSNDKTPYKKGFSATFSRSGRKGIFAGFKPGNESMIAAGTWCPGRNELATLRANIKRDPTRLRQIISAPDFVQYFGEAQPHPKGERQNIFGMEGELKTAPKGVPKDHKDIDLLKCRSFAVAHLFTDGEALDPDFKHKVGVVARVMQPFVHCLNDLMTIADDNTDDDQTEDEDEE